MSIVNDNITEDAEMFSASLTFNPADQARLGNRTHVIVSPDVATVTIQDDEGKHVVTCINYLMVNCQDHNTQNLFHHALWCV